MYEPGGWVSRISPTPLMMIVANQDNVSMTDLGLQADKNAMQPKRLKVVQGGHFDLYLAGFAEASNAALEWFSEHLLRRGERHKPSF
jgi:uncharacterized protein